MAAVFFFVLIFGFVVGVWFAKEVTNHKWISNAISPARIFENNKFFKVVEFENLESWKLLNIHYPEKKEDTPKEVRSYGRV